jgi:hypothetical protein
VGGQRLALSKGLNSLGVSHPSPDEGNRSSFRNVLEYRMMDKVKKNNNLECYKPSSELFRIYKLRYLINSQSGTRRFTAAFITVHHWSLS